MFRSASHFTSHANLGVGLNIENQFTFDNQQILFNGKQYFLKTKSLPIEKANKFYIVYANIEEIQLLLPAHPKQYMML